MCVLKHIVSNLKFWKWAVRPNWNTLSRLGQQPSGTLSYYAAIFEHAGPTDHQWEFGKDGKPTTESTENLMQNFRRKWFLASALRVSNFCVLNKTLLRLCLRVSTILIFSWCRMWFLGKRVAWGWWSWWSILNCWNRRLSLRRRKCRRMLSKWSSAE